MTDSIRVRVASSRDNALEEESYIADVRIGVDKPFFESLVVLLNHVDPDGETFPHNPRGNRSSEPYVRALTDRSNPTAQQYKPLTRVWAIGEHEGTLSSWGFIDRRELLIADILRGSDAGYNAQDFRDVIIRGEAGRGGDFLHYDWASFLGGLGLGLATNFVQAFLTSAGSKVGMVIRTKREDARLAVVAKIWQQRGITSPYVLREWIDKQGELSVLEVARRLQIPAAGAAQLLGALGYEPARSNESTFIRSHRKKALRLRRRWEKQETTTGIDAW